MLTRIQRKRTRGWRMPPGAVYVGRPTPWGNPFAVRGDDYRGWIVVVMLDIGLDVPSTQQCQRLARECGLLSSSDDAVRQCVSLFRAWLTMTPTGSALVERARRELADAEYLACWCPVSPGTHCHADVWVELLTNDNEVTP